MRKTLLLLAAFSFGACSDSDPNLARANAVLKSVPLIDGHNDLPWRIRQDTLAPMDVDKYDLRVTTPGHTDIARLREGRVGAQFWSVYIPGDSFAYGYAKMQMEQIEIARKVVEKYPETFTWALTAADIRQAFKDKKIGSLLGVEGGHAIENDLANLQRYYDLGVRYMTLTHNVTLDWADAANDTARNDGLTRFGNEVLIEMNRMGMLVDLSHVSPATMSDALTLTEAPVIFSHSNARSVTDHVRNVPDSILERLPLNGGIVMVTFVPSFASQKKLDYGRERTRVFAEINGRSNLDSAAKVAARDEWDAANPLVSATLADVADHIDHIKKVAGVDHVGIGGDFDGIDETIVGLEDVSKYPALFAELARRGWSDADLRKLAGENLLRVLERAEVEALRIQEDRNPSTATIEELDGKVVRRKR